MMLRFRLIQSGLFFSLVALIGCSSNSTGPAPGKPGNGDTNLRTLKITPDSSSVTIRTSVTFTLSATPTPLPKPYTITWQIDNAPFVRTSVDTLSCTFTSLGKHSVSAVYTDSTGTKRDSARTIVTVNDTSSLKTSGLGGFKIVVNHDTLDRSQFQNNCVTMAEYTPNTPTDYQLSINLNFSRLQLNGPDEMSIGLVGIVTAPIAATYPIAGISSTTGEFYALFDSTASVEYVSLSGGTLTITKFDTLNNLISGTIQMEASLFAPIKNPNDIDTIAASFSDVGITNRMFNQGAVSADLNGSPYQAADSKGNDVQASLLPSTGVLTILAHQPHDTTVSNIDLFIDAPQVGTFTFGDGKTPGTALFYYYSGNTYTGTQGHTNCGTLTITAFDPVNRRLSGNFTATPTIDGTNTTIPITNGVLDNVQWVQE
jgi:hypothetical protein